eukprot:1142543-Pelagomonas_calceolata.AAC.7
MDMRIPRCPMMWAMESNSMICMEDTNRGQCCQLGSFSTGGGHRGKAMKELNDESSEAGDCNLHGGTSSLVQQES